MGVYRNWVSLVQRKFSKSQTREPKILVNQVNSTSKNLGYEENDREELIAAVTEEGVCDSVSLASVKIEYAAEDIAAIKIQAFYRGYLARRAFRALRSLVKLQALVRGVQVRRQSRMALHCMHALVRLQLSVRTRQMLSNDTSN